MNPLKQDVMSLPQIWEARKRMKPYVQPTPLITSTKLSNQLQSFIHLKLETVHEIGAFKIRGAANKILSLTDAQKQKGVATFSTGNHGLAVAWMAKQLGIRAVICISNRVPDAKVEALKQLNAEIERIGESQDDAEAFCYRLEAEEGLTVINPFDDLEVIAGQGTIGLELMDEVPQLDTVIIPLSGGGLLAGIAFALKAMNPKIEVIGVSMERAAVMAESIRAGKPVVLPEEDTLADSLLGGIGLNNQYTFPMVRSLMDEVVHVSEQEIAEGMVYLLENHRLVTEGAAATGVAALLSGKVHRRNKNIATIITGNNVDLSIIAQILQENSRSNY